MAAHAQPEETDATPRKPGRPRDPGRDAAILDATVVQLTTSGWWNLRIEDVAAGARVSKATIYRRWPSREELMVAALAHFVNREVATPDTGSLRGDLITLLDEVATALVDAGGAALLVSVLQAVREHPGMSVGLREGFIGERRRLAEGVLRRAQDRGELDAQLDVRQWASLAPSMVLFRVLLSGEPVDPPAIRALVDDVVLHALSPR